MHSARSLHLSRFAATAALTVLSVAASPPPPLGPLPDRVTFASADGQTSLVGYVFNPEGPHAARSPAVVMMHGRAGPYSSLANGRYDATTLSQRHQK
jgi:dipeptidyl aminopeptidase/acylaminoacyl peptidase